MRINGKLISLKGKEMTLSLDDDVSIFEIRKLAAHKQPSVEVDLEDGRSISPDQRKKIWALLRDISDYTGDTVESTEDIMKSYTREIFSLEPYSLSNCSMTTARNMLYTMLEFCFKFDIPFKTKTWDMIPGDYAREWFCLRYRKCVICGRHADLAHYETVGMGRNRNKIDESQYHYMALCRVHHVEQHTIGITSFIDKYHIKPIKLSADDLHAINPHYKTGGDANGTAQNA